MPSCDMCGKEDQLVTAEIEGTTMEVCKSCAKFGQIIQKPKPIILKKEKSKPKIILPEKEIILVIVEDYGNRIKNKREQLGLKQEELAKKIGIKESLLHKIESHHFKPSIELARSLEKYLSIKLVAQHEEVHKRKEMGKGDTFTIGDFIKIKEK